MEKSIGKHPVLIVENEALLPIRKSRLGQALLGAEF